MRVKYILNGELSVWRKTLLFAVHISHPTVAYGKSISKTPLISYAMMEKEVFIMENFVKSNSFWKASAQEFKRVKSICIASMMTALNTLLGMFTVTLIPRILIISFSFLASASCAMFCGPLLSGCAGAIADILKHIVNPNGPFFIGYTLNEFLVGMLYGCFFYRREKISLRRCIVARFTVVLILNLFLTPLWLYIMYNEAFFAMVSARLLKNIVMFPIDTFLLYIVMQLSVKIKRQLH